MQSFQIDASALAKLRKKLDRAPNVIEEARREAMESAAPLMKSAVDRAIGGTGKVQSWQGQFVGSKGGYAAVRPLAKTFTEVNGKGKRYAVGQVTNAINSGHRFPSPSGKDQSYRPRIRSARQNVPGKRFYQQAQESLPQIAEQVLGKMETALHEHFEK